MVKSASGKEGMRSFTIVSANKHGGCKTKFGSGGLYRSRTPVAAAKKAFNELCRTKRIKGVCTLIITIKETTRNSKNKYYSYKLNRHKLKTPIILQGSAGEYVIEYKSTAKSHGNHTNSSHKHPCHSVKGQTRGRKLKITSRKSRKGPNNARRMISKMLGMNR
jgi:hypothetical protein